MNNRELVCNFKIDEFHPRDLPASKRLMLVGAAFICLSTMEPSPWRKREMNSVACNSPKKHEENKGAKVASLHHN